MAPVTNGRVLFNEIPTDYPIPGKTIVYDTTQKIDLDTVPLHGGMLVKMLAVSVDPYLRGRMRDPTIESFMPAFEIGESLWSGGVAVVLRSEVDAAPAGTHLLGYLPHQQYAVLPGLRIDTTIYALVPIERFPGVSWSSYLGAAGMPGETAVYGWREYSRAKKVGAIGEVVFVTTGAGPVGSMVIQLAKQDGLKVIASAGSDEKVAFMQSLGADVAFNYKTTDTWEVLKREGPIDIYWDNVGGDSLDAAMEYARSHARFIECGMIANYNGAPLPIKNPGHIVPKSLSFFGFLVADLRAKWVGLFEKEIIPQLARRELKQLEDINVGLDKVGEVMLGVMKGTNTGKTVVMVE
ncbi:unnamed protein product [Mycena citricolor]|uniref:Enoyl reductase (ER) domain-containing protein n=1 Tax=Mycena citricolor TaxID=2018698 RepID=A0AAD2JVH2_9AGAR|nr:unnamed protein product [Mycena citricolor]